MSGGFVDLAEAMAHNVAVEAAGTVNQILDALMPDGRPFGQKKMTIDEQIHDYEEQGWRDDPAASQKWIIQKATVDIPEMLRKFGLPPDKIAAVHPWDIAITAAIAKSAKMETEIAKRQSKELARIAPALVAPTIPETPGESSWPVPTPSPLP